MPRTPNSSITNHEATTDPTVNDDQTKGFDVGSRWVNTSSTAVFFAAGVSTGAAVWKVAAPSGSGNANKNKFDATADPTSTDDSAQGYSIGSRWVNVSASPRREFTCVSATTNAAVWLQTSNEATSADAPGQYFLGSILDYSAVAGSPTSEIQYSRIYLTAGLVISKLQVFVDSGGLAGRSIRLGIYSQSTPASVSGTPNTREVQTNLTATTGADGSFFNVNLTSSFTITTSGYYWLAFVCDSASVKFVVTSSPFRANYAPVRREIAIGTTLPATAGVLTNPSSAIIFVAATE